MIRLLTDHDVNGHIIEGLRRLRPSFELIRVVDENMAGEDDATVLTHAAVNNRIVLSNDRATMRAAAEARIASGEPMPGLFLIRPRATVRAVIDSMIEIDECSEQAEWDNQIAWLPL